MLYYYKAFISKDEDSVWAYVEANTRYVGEEALLKVQENEIYCIESAFELEGWCADNGWDMDDLETVDISLEWLLSRGLVWWK